MPICPSTSLSRTNTDLPTSSDFYKDTYAKGTEHNIVIYAVASIYYTTLPNRQKKNQRKRQYGNNNHKYRLRIYILGRKSETAAKSLDDDVRASHIMYRRFVGTIHNTQNETHSIRRSRRRHAHGTMVHSGENIRSRLNVYL